MKLIITIDTEEDNWAKFSNTDNPVTNIEKLIPLQQMFDRYQAKPTYLISYPVATNSRSIEILKGLLAEGNCEIGTHCHPWNTPPFEEEISDINCMLCNLPEKLVLKKITTLHETICYNFGIVPVAFRSGRWGFGTAVARSLHKLGYKVDTSVSPLVNWGEYHGPDFTEFPLLPYRFAPDDIATPCNNGTLLQVPVTVGFLQKKFALCQWLTRVLETTVGQKLRLKGILYTTGLLNKVWFSPEHADAATMIKLAERLKSKGYHCLNMSFHSTTLKVGLNAFANGPNSEKSFMQKIEKILVYARDSKITSTTLSQYS